MKIDMEIRSDDLQEEDPPDAELHIVYRRLDYASLLEIEEKFIADPVHGLIEAGRKAVRPKSR